VSAPALERSPSPKSATIWRPSASLACTELAAYHARKRGLRLEVRVVKPRLGDPNEGRVIATIERKEPETDAISQVARCDWDGALHTTVATAQAWVEREADRLGAADA
jgi:hypothetical protein